LLRRGFITPGSLPCAIGFPATLKVVTQRICSRCHTVLYREDEGSLVFCWNCGAPQVHLSEELREQIERQIGAQQTAADPLAVQLPQPAPATNAIIWQGAIQCAGLAGAVAGALALVSFALPPVALLSFFWVISAPIIVLGVYSSRFRKTRITTGFAARLGMLTGLAILVATMTLNTIGLVFERYIFHSTAELDLQLSNLFSQMRTTITATSGPAAKTALGMLAIPEYRAGILLSSVALCLVIYLVFSATAGAFAGYLRSRSTR
jgi:hypothetical protein